MSPPATPGPRRERTDHPRAANERGERGGARSGSAAVHVLATPAVDRDGLRYEVRAFAEPTEHGFAGWLEFVPTGAAGRVVVLRTGRETTQGRLEDVAHWAATLGPLYLQGALERAKYRASWTPPAAPVLVRELERPVVDAAGAAHGARIFAQWRQHGAWVAWIEFDTAEGSGPALRTGCETSQADIAAIEYWAGGLGPVYFEGALARAKPGLG
jgi:hypothetical protein